MSTLTQKLEAASHFLLQSPPGEVNDCFNDVRALIADDEALEEGIVPALRMYNEEQLVSVTLNGKQVLIAKGAKVVLEEDNDRYFDPRTEVSFLVNHVMTTATDPEPIKTDPETQAIRSDLDKVLAPYVSNHYNDGCCGVFALPDENYPPEPEPEPQPTPEPVVEPEPVPEPEAEVEKPVEEEKIQGEEESATEVSETVAEEGEKEEKTEEVEEGEGKSPEPIKVDEEEAPVVEAEEKIEEEKVEEEPAKAEVEQEVVAPVEAKKPSYPAIKSRKFAVYVVGNKYNPSNYWTGRWRSTYLVDFAKETLESTININIHYYEQGNVQLTTTFRTVTPLPSTTPSGKEIVALIKTIENSAQTKLSASSNDLSETTFRGLRRALPKTRTKLDWGRIAAYRLGTELGSGSS